MKDEKPLSAHARRAIKAVEELRCTGRTTGRMRQTTKATVKFKTTSLDEAARVEGFQIKLDGKWKTIFRCGIELTVADEFIFVFPATLDIRGGRYCARELASQAVRDKESHKRVMRRLKLICDRIWWKEHQPSLFTVLCR
jgi:hypothetical protein